MTASERKLPKQKQQQQKHTQEAGKKNKLYNIISAINEQNAKVTTTYLSKRKLYLAREKNTH